MRFPPPASKTVLITGCSSGIGWATAQHLRARGWQVMPTARKPDDLERLRTAGFDPIALDLNDSAAVRNAAQQALERFSGQLGGVVNNAGFAQPGAVEDLSRDALRAQFETNVFGSQELTSQLIPAFRKQGWGRIVNVSSVLGRVTLPLLGAYCASKYAVEALSDALRVELRAAGVAVSLIEPGPILSSFRETALRMTGPVQSPDSKFNTLYAHEAERRKDKAQQPSAFMLGPEAVARKIAHALESATPRRRYGVTLPGHIGLLLRRFAPDALWDRIAARELKIQ